MAVEDRKDSRQGKSITMKELMQDKALKNASDITLSKLAVQSGIAKDREEAMRQIAEARDATSRANNAATNATSRANAQGHDFTSQRNADQRRRIWRELGWACIDLDRVMDDWIKQAIVNECIRQNGDR